MGLSYKIIKKNYVDKTSDNGFFIDTDTIDLIDKMVLSEDDIDADIDDEEKRKIIDNIEAYKRNVASQITSEKKNILEVARINAEHEAIRIRDEAHREGYSQGYAQAIEDAEKEASEIKSNAMELMKETKEYSDRYIKENKKNIYELAKAMAENIVNHVVDLDDENIILLIEPILNEYLKEEDITIFTSKKGKTLLEKNRSKLQEICPNTRFIFLEDRSIDKNGFIIENKESIVDLQIRVQLENMVKAISDIDD